MSPSDDLTGEDPHDEPDFKTGVLMLLSGVVIAGALVIAAFALPLNSPPFLIALIIQLGVVLGILFGILSALFGLFVLGFSGYLEGKRRLASR